MIRNDVSWADYLAINRMNPSTLVHGRKSMLHLKQAIDGGTHDDSPALNFGRVFHSVTLKQGTHAVIPDFHLDEANVTQTGKRSKSKGTTYYETALAEWMSKMSGQYDICTREQLEEAEKMSAAVWAKPKAREILETCGENKEVTVHGEICGVPMKGRVDILCPGTIADLKTCVSIDARSFGHDCVKYHYNLKMAIYRELVRQSSCDRECCYIAVEKNPPYDVCVRTIPEVALDNKLREAKQILERYKQCLESGVWPGVDHGNDDEILYVPAWEDEPTRTMAELDWEDSEEAETAF